MNASLSPRHTLFNVSYVDIWSCLWIRYCWRTGWGHASETLNKPVPSTINKQGQEEAEGCCYQERAGEMIRARWRCRNHKQAEPKASVTRRKNKHWAGMDLFECLEWPLPLWHLLFPSPYLHRPIFHLSELLFLNLPLPLIFWHK